mgnify:CR=1 FL=1
MVKLLYFHRFTREITVQLCKRKKRPKLCCVWISTCSSYKLLYFLLICSCEIPQKKICGLWLDTPTIRLKAKICNSRLWQQYILSSFCRHWCLRLVTRHTLGSFGNFGSEIQTWESTSSLKSKVVINKWSCKSGFGIYVENIHQH